MEIKRVIQVQLPTTGPSISFILPGMKALVRQANLLMTVCLNTKCIINKMDLGVIYQNYPATYLDGTYVEFYNNELTKIDVLTYSVTKTQIHCQLSISAFLTFGNIFVLSSESNLYILYIDTYEIAYLCKFIQTTSLIHYSANEIATAKQGSLYVVNTQIYEVKQISNVKFKQNSNIFRSKMNEFVQIDSNINYKLYQFPSNTSYLQAIPSFNDQFLLITDVSGQLDLLQSLNFVQYYENLLTFKFTRNIIATKTEIKQDMNDTEKFNCQIDNTINELNLIKAQLTDGATTSQIELNYLHDALIDLGLIEGQKVKTQPEMVFAGVKLNQKLSNAEIINNLKKQIEQQQFEINKYKSEPSLEQLQTRLNDLERLSKIKQITDNVEKSKPLEIHPVTNQSTVNNQSESQSNLQFEIQQTLTPTSNITVSNIQTQIQKKNTTQVSAQIVDKLQNSKPLTMAERIALFSKK
ncbi:Conserved_hypothetical protein [Hexamita inflata]|uniref:Uncharacterized protein n=1 Tax=Hexamita inflata TaxID=28002 RepID=A0AA86QQJ0_9EUKA|nr:Conserved hypothetical protein [Hexamita inflata]